MLFPKALFLTKGFQKVAKNAIFLLNFFKDFQNFLKISKPFVFFGPNARKINAGLLKNMLK